MDPIFPAACGAAAAAAGCSAAPLQFLLLLLCTAAANVAAPAAGDSQLLPSLAAGYQFSCSAARGCHDRASAPAAATLAAAAAAGFLGRTIVCSTLCPRRDSNPRPHHWH